MLDLLGQAERLAEALGDGPRLVRVLAYVSRCSWWLGDSARSTEAGERALSIARTLDDAALEAVANYHLGLSYMSAGTYGRGTDVYRRSGEILTGAMALQRLGMPALPTVISRAWLGYGRACLGDFAGAVAAAEDALRAAETAGHPYRRVGSTKALFAT